MSRQSLQAKIFVFIFALACSISAIGFFEGEVWAQTIRRIQTSGMARQAVLRNQARVNFYLNDRGTALGQRVFLRIIRNSQKLELFMANQHGEYRFIRNYKICDRAANANNANSISRTPIGIYKISPNGMASNNPQYMRIAVDFPNQYQISRRVIGSMFIQAHCSTGDAISLNDTEMEEVFTIIYAAMARGQDNVPLHIFPFELNTLSVFGARNDPNYRIIRQLEPIYTSFENSKKVPNIEISPHGYRIIPQNQKRKK